MTPQTERELISRKAAKEAGLKTFYTGEKCKNGHIDYKIVSSYECCECNRIKAKNHYHNNHEKELMKRAEYRSREDSRKSNKEYLAIYRKKPENIEARKHWHKSKYQSDSLYAISKRIRNLVSDSINRLGFKKDTETERVLGCSVAEFKIHIERQFTDGMTWENRTQWELDHIIPVSSAKSQHDVIRLNHHTNIRPLWKEDNRGKSDKVLYLI